MFIQNILLVFDLRNYNDMMKFQITPVVAIDLKVIDSFIAEDNEEKAAETFKKI